MSDKILVPVKMVGNERWGNLSALALTHAIVGERSDCKEKRHTFAGQHRVELWHFKKNVYWKPIGVELDITDVKPAGEPPRKQGKR